MNRVESKRRRLVLSLVEEHVRYLGNGHMPVMEIIQVHGDRAEGTPNFYYLCSGEDIGQTGRQEPDAHVSGR